VAALGLLGAVAARAQSSANARSLQQLRLESYVLPEFPDFVRLTGTARGIVTVAIGRNSEGFVDDVLVLDSTHPRLAHAVETAVLQWRFARPANQALPGAEIVPIVRFIFAASGLSVVSPAAGQLAGRDAAATLRDDAPVVLPRLADLDAEVKPLRQPMPKLTTRAGAPAATGTARVKFFIDERGRVRVPVVLEATSRELGEAALAAIAQWRYEPPRIAGRPTLALETAEFQFDTTKGSAP
jgi:TonB family protein